jgi:D-alanyl-D-alanine carboxypeptidase
MSVMRLMTPGRLFGKKVETLTTRLRKLYAFSLAVWLVAAPAARPQSSAIPSNGDLTSAMDKVASAVYKPGAPGAAIIVVKGGRVIFRKGYGLANLELTVPVRPETVFRLCSVTKQFTAVAVMMLVEQGKLALDDPITKFFPDYPTDGRKITVENLLTHTSGVKDYLDKLWPQRMRQDMRPEKLIELFENDGLEFEPGTKESYSNSNYVLLGAILEKVSGEEYGRFVEDNIFKPLGMKHSYYEGVQDLIPNRASGYVKYEGSFINAPYVSTPQLYAAGALCSTVDDLALWDAAVYADRLLKRSSWERLFTPYKLANGETSDFAYGWAISRLQGRGVASHAGGIPGFRAYVLRVPADRVYVAVLSNDEPAEEQPEYVARRLAAIAIGRPITEPKIVKLDPKVLDAYVGQYQEGADETLTVRREGDRLLGEETGNPEFEMFPVSDAAFIVKAFDAQLSFVKDAQGKVTGLIYRFGGHDTSLKKIK